MGKFKAADVVRQARQTHSADKSEIDVKKVKLPAAELHSGNSSVGKEVIRRFAVIEVEPSLCAPWEFHNRDEAWLNVDGCKDLIESIRKNGQQEPGLVRVVKGESEHKYEIIYGVRRWYACSQIPNKKFLARVADIDDKQCTILMHLENADSKDITEFERAHSFLRQFRAGFFKNQSEMAAAFGVSQGLVSRMIKAAEIYEHPWISELFPSKVDINVKAAYTVSQLLNSETGIKNLKVEVQLIKDELQVNNQLLPAIILKRLAATGESKVGKFSEIVLMSKQGQNLITSKSNSKTLILSFDKHVNTYSQEEIIEVVVNALKSFVG